VKTAVSLPDKLFREAEAAAKTLGVSRSQFYARALTKFLEMREPEHITTQLNEVYGRRGAKVDPVLDRMQRHALRKADW